MKNVFICTFDNFKSALFDDYQTLNYEPGDHVGVCAKNRPGLVNGLLEKMTGVADPDEVMQLQVLHEKHTSNGKSKNFVLMNDDDTNE